MTGGWRRPICNMIDDVFDRWRDTKGPYRGTEERRVIRSKIHLEEKKKRINQFVYHRIICIP
jgi:hypothetical protein